MLRFRGHGWRASKGKRRRRKKRKKEREGRSTWGGADRSEFQRSKEVYRERKEWRVNEERSSFSRETLKRRVGQCRAAQRASPTVCVCSSEKETTRWPLSLSLSLSLSLIRRSWTSTCHTSSHPSHHYTYIHYYIHICMYFHKPFPFGWTLSLSLSLSLSLGKTSVIHGIKDESI